MFLHLPIRTLEVCTEVLPGFSHVHSTDHFNTTLLSQGCILEAASGNEKGKLNAQSKDRGGCDESPGVRVQLVGQTRDFPGSLMTFHNKRLHHKNVVELDKKGSMLYVFTYF